MTEPQIRHDADRRRFETEVDGHPAELTYRLDGTVMWITHTGVPEPIGGRGVAGRLVRAALDHARAAGWRVVPACSYAAAWMRRHPDYADLVAG
ncbi:MAG TPA: GNAT family N-acetyltransferase [Pseudoxanthomonas sp.]|nr:GNAT family N-acetyltransferase [Pseudoxanthomonas sp.]